MELEDLKKVYDKVVIRESKSPYHFDASVKRTEEVLAYNPMCGDKYKLQLHSETGQVDDIHFHGFGCALSKASTSAMIRWVKGKTLSEVKSECEKFLATIDGKEKHTFDQEVLKVLVELNDLGSRSDCIKLSWKALLEYLEEKH